MHLARFPSPLRSQQVSTLNTPWHRPDGSCPDSEWGHRFQLNSFGELRCVVPSTADGLGWDGDFAAAAARHGAVADLALPPGPLAAHSVAADARRCLLAPTPGRCRRAATRTTSPMVTSAAGALLSLRCIRRCTGWCGGLTLPTTRAQGYHAQGCHAHSGSLARTRLPGPAGH